jgi:hypothetical protein
MEDNQSPPTSVPSDTPATNEPYDLDLDLLQPQTKHVKLGDKVYDVHPPKVKDVAELMRYGAMLSSSNANGTEGLDGLLNIFYRLMPALKQDGVDLSLPQMESLFNFISGMASPAENSALKAMGVEPTQSQEKKAPPE